MKVEIFLPAQCFQIDGVPDDDDDIALALIASWASDKARQEHQWWKMDTCATCEDVDRMCKCGSGECTFCCTCQDGSI